MVLLGGGTALRLKKRRLLYTLVVLMLLLSGLIGTAAAQSTGEGGDSVLPAERSVDDDYFAAGQAVTVKGRITGDMFATGNNIAAEGEVGGDLISMGRRIDAGGRIEGDIRAAGQIVNVSGNVGRSVTAAGQKFTVSKNGVIGGNVLAAGETLRVDGKVEGMVRGAADTVIIAGEVGGDVDVSADHVVVMPEAKIAGNLTYKSAAAAEIRSGAQINGEVEQLPAPRAADQSPAGRIWKETLTMLSLLALALFLAFLLPLALEQVADTVRSGPWRSLGLGAGALVVIPIVAVLLFITVVGATLGWFFLAAYGAFLSAGIILGKIILGFLLGVSILRAVLKKEQVSPIWSVLLGTAIIKLVAYLPYVGWLVELIAMLLTLGALLYLAWRHWFRRPAVA